MNYFSYHDNEFESRPFFTCKKAQLYANLEAARNSSALLQNVENSSKTTNYLENSIFGNALKNLHTQFYNAQDQEKQLQLQNRGTQTDYRESECQTVPWDPPYSVPQDQNPEILMLSRLTWNDGLPVGMHEIQLVQHLKTRRACENLLPPMDKPANIKRRMALIRAIERVDWQFRESQMDEENKLRMSLARKMLEKFELEKQWVYNCRLKMLEDKSCMEKFKKIHGIRKKFSRELRKLSVKHNAKKEFDSRKVNQLLRSKKKLELKVPDKLKRLLPSWLFPEDQPRYLQSKEDPKLCPKIQSHCNALLKKYSDASATSFCKLLLRNKKKVSPVCDFEAILSQNQQQAIVLAQKTERGKKTKKKEKSGTIRYRELIDDVRAHKTPDEANFVQEMYREVERQNKEERKIQEVIESLEGTELSGMLTNLNKDLKKLENERRAHFLSLISERKRIKKYIESCVANYQDSDKTSEKHNLQLLQKVLRSNEESIDAFLIDAVRADIECNAPKEIQDRRVETSEDSSTEEFSDSDECFNIQVELEKNPKFLEYDGSGILQRAYTTLNNALTNLSAEDLLSALSSEGAYENIVDYSEIHNYMSNRNLGDWSSIDSDGLIYEKYNKIIELILFYAQPEETDLVEVSTILLKILRNFDNN